MHLDNRWQVSEPDGRKKGMLVAWSQRVEIKHRWTNEFCVELRLKYESESTDVWVIFVHECTDVNERHQQ